MTKVYKYPTKNKESKQYSLNKTSMEIKEDIVIIGAGLAGLTTSLALHRLGLRSIVLESADSLRVTGFALSLWKNGFGALDAVGVGDILRERSFQMHGFLIASGDSFIPFGDLSFGATDNSQLEARCVRRKDLLEVLEKELPQGTIRYSSKVVLITETGQLKSVHLADGSVIRAKALIGCDGINSMVAKRLGLQKPVDSGRAAIRGFVQFPEEHGILPNFYLYFENGVRFGFLPCDATSVYWFCTFSPTSDRDYEDMEQDPLKMKQFVLSKTENAPKQLSDIVQRTALQFISSARLKLRLPWNTLLGDIAKNNICVAGDAFHPMTPDIGQGGGSALEDGIVLARCLGQALLPKSNGYVGGEDDEGYGYDDIEKGLMNYVKQRRWRSFSLISTAYLVGVAQQSEGKIMNFLKKLFLTKYSTSKMRDMADFDCGKLEIS
ncbi:hypothetical protein Leryth_017590 [Lithospermum erythrorhizon]|nr:hypothetical protein Leryth_017590 [Lithospermum erythrorhizon]